ncbi:hypothetical protein NPIL_122381 [Nephila pilipes]|uniref:Uncharacterized protein n=1 Tax=Nephila pilipes TaxID=299642 RepID=A0A8X6UL79_NEPPI|nr:hypothetical protein NPIL_122381 [Nephila pilipes]
MALWIHMYRHNFYRCWAEELRNDTGRVFQIDTLMFLNEVPPTQYGVDVEIKSNLAAVVEHPSNASHHGLGCNLRTIPVTCQPK